MDQPLPPRHHTLTLLAIVLGFFVFALIAFSSFLSIDAEGRDNLLANSSSLGASSPQTLSATDFSFPKVVVSHKKTPESVKAIYMSSWVAGSKEAREKMLKRIEGTNINSIVLDIKDTSGKIVIKLNSPALVKYQSEESRVSDITEFVDDLHQRGYYVIGHIAVFQDNYLTRVRPDLSMRRQDNNEIWRDAKGMAWLDVSQQEVWDYNIALAREAYSAGFDELNFDYVRFPTDGDISQIRYRNYDPNKETRVEALRKFFVYLHDNIQDIGVPTSANVFGMVTTNDDDLGIGQVIANVAPYVDYIAPMLYPSHYPKGWNGFKNPATVPYKVVKISMDSGIKKIEALGLSKNKLRPWLQDFDLGATYTAEMVRAQHEAVSDAGLNSWMMWDATNKYTLSAYQKEDN
ncbi:MAG TPA: putative glycoside hydrolase [Candidatus Paceibacterota bacterium]|nr:putative glycoside hydrolase [Candidatus Paceibacterota bacterium]